MKRQDCDYCDGTVVIAEDGEKITQGETPVEHMERTGHPHKREPRLTACRHCGFAWWYTGTGDRATCPECGGKNTPGEIPDEVDNAYAKADSESAA